MLPIEGRCPADASLSQMAAKGGVAQNKRQILYQAVEVRRIKIDCRILGDLRKAASFRNDHRTSVEHGLEDRHAEALIQ
jgi:hypothetical protein